GSRKLAGGLAAGPSPFDTAPAAICPRHDRRLGDVGKIQIPADDGAALGREDEQRRNPGAGKNEGSRPREGIGNQAGPCSAGGGGRRRQFDNEGDDSSGAVIERRQTASVVGNPERISWKKCQAPRVL